MFKFVDVELIKEYIDTARDKLDHEFSSSVLGENIQFTSMNIMLSSLRFPCEFFGKLNILSEISNN